MFDVNSPNRSRLYRTIVSVTLPAAIGQQSDRARCVSNGERLRFPLTLVSIPKILDRSKVRFSLNNSFGPKHAIVDDVAKQMDTQGFNQGWLNRASRTCSLPGAMSYSFFR